MTEVQSRKLTGKMIAVLILIAVGVAVLLTLLQEIFLGHSIPAVTGAVVGVIISITVVNVLRKKSDSGKMP